MHLLYYQDMYNQAIYTWTAFSALSFRQLLNRSLQELIKIFYCKIHHTQIASLRSFWSRGWILKDFENRKFQSDVKINFQNVWMISIIFQFWTLKSGRNERRGGGKRRETSIQASRAENTTNTRRRSILAVLSLRYMWVTHWKSVPEVYSKLCFHLIELGKSWLEYSKCWTNQFESSEFHFLTWLPHY